jgi:hypothetical protein
MERPQVETTACQLNRGGDPGAPACEIRGAARAMTRQRRMPTLPGPHPAEIGSTGSGAIASAGAHAWNRGHSPFSRCVTEAGETMKQTGSDRKQRV